MSVDKIKIDYIIPTLDKGGAERFFVDLIKNIDREIFIPRLVLYKKGGEWLEEIKALNIDYVILKKEHKFSIVNFIALYKTIKNRKPDIIHCQLGADIYGALAGKMAGVKKIITTEVNTNKDESFIYNKIKRLSLKFVTWTVAVSEAVADDFKTRYKIDADKVLVIYNGIDLNRFNPSLEKNLLEFNDQKEFIFGTIGRLTPQKGQLYLIQAFAKLKNKNSQLFIAGEGELKEELEIEIKKLHLTKRVKLLGLVNTPDFLQQIDVFVLPSIWEGMGIVLVEAALSGVPIIATKVGGVLEVVNKESAYLVKAQDSLALSKEMKSLMENINTLELACKIERAAKEVRLKFDILNISKEYQELYNSL